MTKELTSRAAVVWAVAFEGCGKSREWQAGALRGLQVRLGEPTTGPSLPYAPGTAEYDAWAAGIQAGHAEARYQLERELLA